jgi:hypothetical protein
MNVKNAQHPNGRLRIRLGLALTLLGYLIFMIGAEPVFFGLDRSPVIGFVQITVFLIGLALICLGGYITVNGLWFGHEKTILADIGLRLVSTGLVIAVVSGMADVFGFGSQLSPEIPYYGSMQALGVLIGEIVIALGFILQIPFGVHQDPVVDPVESVPEENQEALEAITN